MSTYTPGQFKQKLLDKVRGSQEENEEDLLPQIKKDPTQFRPNPTEYLAAQRASLQTTGTATLPKDSPLNKPVHERMKDFVKEQYKPGK